MKVKLESEFLVYLSQKDFEKMVTLLSDVLATGELTDEETGWAYWNISDALARLRAPNRLLANHRLFDAHVRGMDAGYLHWPVSDATQKLTLYSGGYGQFWDECYLRACEDSHKTAENRRVRFESHRAAVAGTTETDYPFDPTISYLALDNMKAMLGSELAADDNFNFYEITYFTKWINFNHIMNLEKDPRLLEDSLAAFTCILDLSNAVEETGSGGDLLLGSWEQLNRTRSKLTQAKTGICNYIITLVNAENYSLALECYEKAKNYPMSFNHYFDTKIKLAETICQ